MPTMRQLIRLAEDVWHGTPHKFDKFSTEFNGSGEGHATFGWGLYFTSTKEVAEHYRKMLTRHFTYKGRKVPEESWLHSAIYWLVNYNFDKEAAAASWKPTSKVHALILGLDPSQIRIKGHLYKVHVPDAHEFLLWDKPFDAQSSLVQQVLSGLVPGSQEMTGGDAYDALADAHGGQKAASLALLAKGVHGIRYLDGVSREHGEGSCNYVLFDGEDTTITQRF